MANKNLSVTLKRSAVPSAVPTAAQLALGELAINTYDGKLYILKDNGTQSVIQVSAYEQVVRETPAGTVNSINTAFVLAYSPRLGSESVYMNGMLQDAGTGNDYVISAATITFQFAPLLGAKIRVNYTR